MQERERFVPKRVGHIVRALTATFDDDAHAADFRALARIVGALYHFDFHDHEQTVLEAWDTAAEGDSAILLRDELRRFLEAANYVEVSMGELQEAMKRESLIPLRLEVDVDDYEDLLIYRRGSHVDTVEVSRWRGLRTVRRDITVEDRVVVLARVKPAEWFESQGTDPASRNLVPGGISLKQFQEVPRADIEMLLPSTRVRFRPIDTLIVGVPALASGIVVLATKLLPTLGLIFVFVGAWLGIRDEEPEIDQGALVALFGGLVTLGGFLLRQWTKLKNRRVEYLKTLSETLYFRTLADGPGVLHTLLTTAEQQEVIEILVGYRFLLDAPGSRTVDELDGVAEQWLHETCAEAIDFDVGDAVEKLLALGLAEGTDRLTATPLPAALALLDSRWDDLFRFGNATVPTTTR